MKKSFILHLLLINVFIIPLHAENMLTKVRDYFYTTRLFAGYHSSPAEKAVAREKLEQLLLKRHEQEQAIRTFLQNYHPNLNRVANVEKIAIQQMLDPLSLARDPLQNLVSMIDNEQEKQVIRSKINKITEINKQIAQQRIILGQKWTGARTVFLFGTGLLGLATLGRAGLMKLDNVIKSISSSKNSIK